MTAQHGRVSRHVALVGALASALVIGLVGAAPAVAAGAQSVNTGVGVAADASTPTISGTVTFRGVGVPGAKVSVSDLVHEDEMNPDGNPVWIEEFAGTTDASGHYSIDVWPGSYLVSAGTDRPSDYLVSYNGNTVRVPDAKILKVTSGANLSADIALVAAAKVTGKVTDSSGEPLGNVSVAAGSTGRSGGDGATTRADGTYTIGGLPTGTVVVYAEHPVNAFRSGRAYGQGKQQTVSVRAGDTTTVPTITLPPVAAVTGKLSARYPRNQELSLLDTKHRQVAQATPDSKGNVKFTGLKQGAYRVVLSGTNISKRVVVRTGSTSSFGTIKRADRTDIKGVVLSPSGKPVAGASVSVTDSFGTRAGEAVTDSKGRYSVSSHAISGTYRVAAGSSRYATGVRTTTVAKGKDKTGVTVTLRTPGTLTGVVKNAKGKGIAGVDVDVVGSTSSASATTDSSGRWTIRGLVKGTRNLRFADPNPGGYAYYTAKPVTVVPSKTVTVPTVTLH